jgi:transposase-like protein
MRVKDNTRFQAFVQDLQESFWGDFQGRTREVLKQPLERDAEQQMAEYLGLKWHERARPEERVDYRNGFYERDYVTSLGVLRTTNVMERCFVEVRRRTRPMVVFTNVASVDRIMYAIFSRLNEDWKNHTLEPFTQAA